MCERNHTDPNDNPSERHIATCYKAWEEYWDRDGLMSEDDFNSQPAAERLAELMQYGDKPLLADKGYD